ncbi:MAG: macA [Cyanobacteria bacterium RYN_339]|nr:macA [Cyanobacteria bacterium RYN_339]
MRTLVILAVGLALAGCKPTAPAAGGGEEKAATATIQTATATRATVGGRVEAPGNVVALPGHVAGLMPATPSRILAVRVAAGDRVSRGQVLATLAADPMVQADAQKAAIALAQAERELHRQERLVAGGVAPRVQLEQARAAYETTRADHRARQAALALALGNTTLRAPFAGIVTQAGGSTGQVADTAAPLVTVTDLAAVGVEADLPVAVGTSLAPGTRVDVTAGAVHQRGVVRGVQGVVDAASQRVRVLITVPNPGAALRPGMFATVGVARGGHEAVVLPGLAVVPRGAMTVVYVIMGDEAKEREVKTAPAANGQVEVLTGLMAGEVVATIGAYVLSDGMKVKTGAEADEAATGDKAATGAHGG